jgi:hypothetical protein
VVQLGVAAGPATIGTAFFDRLGRGDFVAATRSSLWVGLAVFGVALAASFLLPRTARLPRARSEEGVLQET